MGLEKKSGSTPSELDPTHPRWGTLGLRKALAEKSPPSRTATSARCGEPVRTSVARVVEGLASLLSKSQMRHEVM